MSQDKPTKSPVIVMIPRTDLVVPDWNPRKFMEEGPLQVLTDYIAKGGPVPRILAWKGNGVAPLAVISGQRRLEAYKRLGRDQVEVEILDITLEEAMIMANTSNDNEALFWLDRYEGWERLKREQVWDQATLALKLGKSNAQTNRAIRTLRVLNANSRQLIRETLPGPGTGGSQKGPKITPSISDRNRMHDLKPISGGDNLDPEDNTPPGVLTSWMTLPLTAFLTNPESKNDDREAQAQAEKALPIMIARGLSGAQTNQLVESIKAGNSPETFQVPVISPKVKKQSTAKTEIPLNPPLSKGDMPSTPASPTHPQAHSTEPVVNLSNHSGQGAPAGPSLGQALGDVFSHVAQLKVVHTKGWAGLLALVLILFLSAPGMRMLSRWLNSKTESPKMAITTGSSGTTKAQDHQNQKPVEKALFKTGSTPTGRSPQAGVAGTRAGGQPQVGQPSAKAEAALANDSNKMDQGKLIAWAEADSPYVSQFVDRFYGLSYSGYQDNFDYFKQQVADGYLPEFMSGYFPPEKIRDMQEKKLAFSFQPSQPPRLVNLDGVMDEFQVTGTLTTVSHAGKTPLTLSAQPVALKVNLRHIAGAKGLVYRVSVINPQGTEVAEGSPASKSPASASQSQPGVSNKEDGVAKFVGDAAGAAAKKALGFNF